MAPIVERLAEIATVNVRLADEGTRSTISCIYWLQERGHISADEYNGMLYSWREGRLTLAVDVNPYGPRGVVATGPTRILTVTRGAKGTGRN